ncbi:fibroblast growth factor-binding protein 2 [Petromyzon marinus]|uniref:fibroblast growth factor-binding protein 2 n=1 Tax=Petromyzon marinus TaxID=7757 RepID=UPI003F71E468
MLWGALLLTALIGASLGPSLGTPQPGDTIAEIPQPRDPLAESPEPRDLSGDTLPRLRRDAAPRTPRAPSGGSFRAVKGDACRWATKGSPKSRISLSVTCDAPDGGGVECQYQGKPAACKAFAKREAKYWTQALKALKSKKEPCGGHATIKPHVCRDGPREAFLTKDRTKVTKSPSKFKSKLNPPKKTPKAEKTKSKAPSEQYCSETWNAFCSFFVNLYHG